MNNRINEATTQELPNQIVLLGDSIFDNAPYVNDGESVSEQLQCLLNTKSASTATQVQLLAIDGDVMKDVSDQIANSLPQHKFNYQCAFLSCGGNDLLTYSASGLLSMSATTVGDALKSINKAREYFRRDYQNMLDASLAKFPHLTVSTIYDCIPSLSEDQKVAIALFNEVILHEAEKRQLKVLDLRVICDEFGDYAPISPIEPSKQGAAKIAQAIFNQYHSHSSSIAEVCA